MTSGKGNLLIGSICSCPIKAITKLLRLSSNNECSKQQRGGGESIVDKGSISQIFSVDPSLQESSIAPMSSMVLSSEPSFLLSESDSMIGYGTETAMTLAQDDDSPRDDKISKGSDEEMLRPNNLDLTSFDGQGRLGALPMGNCDDSRVESIVIATFDDRSSSADDDTNGEAPIKRKKYPVTPHVKLSNVTDFSSPGVFKKIGQLPNSVLALRRGLVKERVRSLNKFNKEEEEEEEKL